MNERAFVWRSDSLDTQEVEKSYRKNEAALGTPIMQQAAHGTGRTERLAYFLPPSAGKMLAEIFRKSKLI